MPEFEYNNLFSESGPQNMLDYLQGRLAARDFSAEEALAMLGAVHEELSNSGTVVNCAVYQKYSEFMEALRTEMPDVHDYVVSAWEQRGQNNAEADDQDEREDDNSEDGENIEPEGTEAVKKSEAESLEGGDASEGGGDEDGGEEGDEPNEDEEKAEGADEEELVKSEAEKPEERI